MFHTRGFHSPRYRYTIYKVTAHGGVWSAYRTLNSELTEGGVHVEEHHAQRGQVDVQPIADAKGYSVDAKGYSVDAKGYSVDAKGYIVDLVLHTNQQRQRVQQHHGAAEGGGFTLRAVDSSLEGVVWSSEATQGPQHRLQTANQGEQTYPYWARLLHRCTARPTIVRASLLGSHGQGPGVRCKPRRVGRSAYTLPVTTLKSIFSSQENIPATPASDWSITRIYLSSTFHPSLKYSVLRRSAVEISFSAKPARRPTTGAERAYTRSGDQSQELRESIYPERGPIRLGGRSEDLPPRKARARRRSGPIVGDESAYTRCGDQSRVGSGRIYSLAAKKYTATSCASQLEWMLWLDSAWYVTNRLRYVR
eukprot:1196074-Prorocentrum_minimum.AAC.2